ncbi:cystathionine gamma-synthase [Xylaria bambusicola]|uniref:cystathionine gamma-synthase n=1 Tax=Xylaria bambusicola TaxID=326684 RepID=UPI002007DC75|nr:cystathionine gamma-synthase [Xylaria bambusicola]KAI0523726.1 cystathionine gamma-synthase [Xylaria bambusicola]
MALSNIDPSTFELGQSLPPRGAHTITTHLPGWEAIERFRDRDVSILESLKSLYPRFFPFGHSAALCQAIGERLPLPEGYRCSPFVSRDAWASSERHATSDFRKQLRLEVSDLRYYVVEVAGVRLFVLAFPQAKAPSAGFQWAHGGLIVSTRLAEALLSRVDSLVYVGEFPGGVGAPDPTFLPEGNCHRELRERIATLLMRACVREHGKSVDASDVYLYQTGMASITRLLEGIEQLRAGPAIIFGSVFHSTYYTFEDSQGGLKHYGRADTSDLDNFEEYLARGGQCACVFTEFPSNPLAVGVDLTRLRGLADRYGFFLIVDDTCASFANMDLLGVADVIVTSLTKAFSGYADVMAGSVVLNPNSAHFATLKEVVSSRFHNELFEADVVHLLSNNENYLARCMIHNRNASALASYFQSLALDPSSPITRVWYPPYSPGSDYLKSFLRKSTAEYPAPGYGFLLSVEFETLELATTFFNAVNFFKGPHIGAHLTIVVPFNHLVWGKNEPERHASYGLRPQQIRIAVGLEDQEVLVRRCTEALEKVTKVARK